MINNSPFGRNNTPFIFVIAILIFSHFKDTALSFRYNENVIICVFFKNRSKWMYINGRKSTRLHSRWNFTVGRFKIYRKYPPDTIPKNIFNLQTYLEALPSGLGVYSRLSCNLLKASSSLMAPAPDTLFCTLAWTSASFWSLVWFFARSASMQKDFFGGGGELCVKGVVSLLLVYMDGG